MSDKEFKVMFGAMFVLWLSVVITIIYVAHHFIAKYW